MIERTFAMIKPDAIKAKQIGKIIDMIEQHGFEILRMQKTQLSKKQAETFYAIHKERPFFKELVEFIVSGPVIIMTLEKNNAIADWRNLMGATDPVKAAPGTIRKLYGTSIGTNVVHGSDAPETATIELGLFFPDLGK
jgi:nucleoside-diphosphate kinase